MGKGDGDNDAGGLIQDIVSNASASSKRTMLRIGSWVWGVIGGYHVITSMANSEYVESMGWVVLTVAVIWAMRTD